MTIKTINEQLIINKHIKEGKKLSKCEEYTTLNIVSLYEKVIRLYVKKKLVEHINNNNLLIGNLSGYKKNQ